MVARPRPLALLVLACAAVGAARPRAAAAQRIAEIQIAPAYLRMRQDAVTRISATAYDADGKPIDVPFRWQSSNINVVVVDSLGNVRALAPGGAVVTAATDDAGRRRRGQATVIVMREMPGRMPGPGGPGFSPPGAGAPGMVPPGAPAPGTHPEPPHMWVMDSAMRASINCAEPMINAVNPMRACWDVRAAVRDSVEEPERPGSDRCRQGASPVSLLVQVTETGDVGDVRPFAPSSCPEFTERVTAAVHRLRFTPALRAGKPVSSWRLLRLRGR